MGKGFEVDVDGAIRTLNRAIKEFKGDARKIFKSWVGEVFAEIVERTPVDTGNAQSAWVLEFKEGLFGISAIITNGTAYIVRLEFGWSAKAPQGMVRVTLSKREKILIRKLERLATGESTSLGREVLRGIEADANTGIEVIAVNTRGGIPVTA